MQFDRTNLLPPLPYPTLCEHSEQAPSRRPPVGGVGLPSGLVHSSTSHPPIEIDPSKMRLRRMKQGVITAARLHDQECRKGGFRYKAAFLTLTYRDDQAWKPDHISKFMHCVRRYMDRRGINCRYVSVMELTIRGIPHYHVVFWLPVGFSLPKPDKRGWWPHGMTKIEWARNAVGYMAKYAAKGEKTGSKFPKGARIHATGGLSKDSRMERSWWLSPGWVKKRWPLDQGACPRPARGGGWFSLSGEWEPSPWVVMFENGRLFIRKKIGADQLTVSP